MLTAEELEAIRARQAGAESGPMEALRAPTIAGDPQSSRAHVVPAGTLPGDVRGQRVAIVSEKNVGRAVADGNAAFMAAAFEDVPALLDHIEEREAEIATLLSELQRQLGEVRAQLESLTAPAAPVTEG